MLKTTEESARAFLATRKTLVMATTGEDGAPTASYAPFVKWGDDFYVYTSALSRHTKDLLRSPNVSILFIEDGASAKNLFALERLTFPCRTTTVSQNGNEWKVVMTLFRKKFGKIFGLIRPLGDFFLFRMEPEDTVYVQAFGRAYHLTKDLQDPQHITGVGHKGAEIDTAKGVRGSRASGKKR
ncbi:MAG: pyridoxamine 5'-phosphate oxidase family protein [bacterium]|nr:pyridoxamine 5'-phosphate oxidase family protein [bacterium]